MKRAMRPILWIAAAVVVLIVLAYVYEQKWGIEGPFHSDHHH